MEINCESRIFHHHLIIISTSSWTPPTFDSTCSNIMEGKLPLLPVISSLKTPSRGNVKCQYFR